MQKGSKFCHELTIEEFLRGEKVIYVQVLGFSLCAVTFPTEGVLQAGVHARVVTLGSRVALAGILQISP